MPAAERQSHSGSVCTCGVHVSRMETSGTTRILAICTTQGGPSVNGSWLRDTPAVPSGSFSPAAPAARMWHSSGSTRRSTPSTFYSSIPGHRSGPLLGLLGGGFRVAVTSFLVLAGPLSANASMACRRPGNRCAAQEPVSHTEIKRPASPRRPCGLRWALREDSSLKEKYTPTWGGAAWCPIATIDRGLSTRKCNHGCTFCGVSAAA